MVADRQASRRRPLRGGSGAGPGRSALRPTHLDWTPGARSVGAATSPRPAGGGATGVPHSGSAPPLAWPKRVPTARGRRPRGTRRAAGTALERHALESPGAAARPVLGRGPGAGRGGRTPRAGVRPVVRLRPDRSRHRPPPRASAAPLAVARGPLWHRRSDPPHAPRPSRTARTDRPPPTASGSRLVVAVEVRRNPEEDHGGTGRATTGPPARGTAQTCSRPLKPQRRRWNLGGVGAKILRPAPPGAGATRPQCRLSHAHGRRCAGVGLLQRQVGLDLLTHAPQVPGNHGAPATPTAAVVWSLFVHGAWGTAGRGARGRAGL